MGVILDACTNLEGTVEQAIALANVCVDKGMVVDAHGLNH